MKIYIFITALLILSKCAFSKNLFETTFYNIEFTSKNIEDDKVEEIKKIKFKSLLSIFEKTLIDDDYNNLKKKLDENLINTFIKNIVIEDEIIINDKYLSKIKINYNKKKIINFLREKKIPYVEFYPDKFLLIIFEKDGFNENLFTQSNNFYNHYINFSKNNNFFKIPNIDINDRFLLKKKDIENRNFEKIINFSNKYDISNTIVLITNKIENQLSYDLILYSNGESIEIKLNYSNFNFDNFFKTLEDETIMLWKQINQIQNNSKSFINCKVNYYNMLELKEIRNNLNNVSIIENLQIKSLSYRSTEYDIYFFGNYKILSKLININNLKIYKNHDSCVLRLK